MAYSDGKNLTGVGTPYANYVLLRNIFFHAGREQENAAKNVLVGFVRLKTKVCEGINVEQGEGQLGVSNKHLEKGYRGKLEVPEVIEAQLNGNFYGRPGVDFA